MWPTKLLLIAYDKLNHRNILGEYYKLQNTISFDLHSIKQYQENKLKAILEYAAKYILFYRNILKKYNVNSKEFSPFSILNELPILTKDDIRNNFDNLISDQYRNTKNICFDFTGGSTGQPLKFAYDRNYKDIRWAMIYNNLIWAGYNLGDSHGFIYGSNYDAKKQYSLRQKIQSWCMNSFQVNAFFLNDHELEKFSLKCLGKKPKFIIGYATALIAFARFVKSKNLPIEFSFIESTSEYLSSEMKEEVEDIFKCKVYDRYGCREVGNIAHECEYCDGLHINWQIIYVEIINKGAYPWLGQEFGDIVITSLENKGMPLIRYIVGDIGKIENDLCKCKMQSARLYLAGTRSGDLLYSIDGGQVSPPALTLAYKDLSGIKNIQFVQSNKNSLDVNIVKTGEYYGSVQVELFKRLQKIFGYEMRIKINFVDKIEKELSGKYRLTKCLFREVAKIEKLV
jgi:phenylacetate-CoA ligase